MSSVEIGTPEWDRFWAKVDTRGDCWLWTGAPNDSGYGRFWLDGGLHRAHRVSWESLVGPIPADLTIDHLCRVRACVNPDHLEPVPMGLNARRGAAGAVNRNRQRAVTTCPQGHPYTPQNTYTDKRGKRNCRECNAAAQIRYRARRAA